MADWIYLDNHTRARPNQKLIEEMARGMRDYWLIAPTQKAKDKICDAVGSSYKHFYLTSGTAENHFHVLFSHYMDCMRETGRTHILALEEIKWLEKFDVQGKVVPVNAQGQLTAELLQNAIRPRSSILTLSWADPLTGVIQPIQDLIAVCKQNDIKVHLDISAAIGKLYLLDLDVDYLSFDGLLFHAPGHLGGILSKERLSTCHNPFTFSSAMTLATALELAQDKIDHYALEVARLRELLEKKMEELGAKIYFQDVDRLPNVAVVAFDGIHGEMLLAQLKKQGVFAKIWPGDPSAISFALSDETTQEEIEQLSLIMAPLVSKRAFVPFSEVEAKQKNMRVVTGSFENVVTLSLLVDEEDGVIADCKFDLFGPPALHDATNALEQLLLRKNYLQAKRISANLIEGKMATTNSSYINLLLDLLDQLTERCMDIPIEDFYTAPPEMEEGGHFVYPNWETLSGEQKKGVIAEVIDRDIRPYVELDAGGVEVVKVEDNRVTIAYSGNCTSCYSATGSTLEAIGNILRRKVYPDLMVVPDTSLLYKS
ncbi:MAG: aminotransferase class V-fold PLP-dependent enzyme [Verrucomicrobia bacterium]|nr:aminotransferase class V-fold PLP-dependent enzyme [Verrucomicrobiota bacterium]